MHHHLITHSYEILLNYNCGTHVQCWHISAVLVLFRKWSWFLVCMFHFSCIELKSSYFLCHAKLLMELGKAWDDRCWVWHFCTTVCVDHLADCNPFQKCNNLMTLNQLCPTQMAYWTRNYVTVFSRVAHWMTYYWGLYVE